MTQATLSCSEVYPGLWIGAHPESNTALIRAAGFDLHLDVRGESPPTPGAQAEVQTVYLPLFDNAEDRKRPLTQDVLLRVKNAGKRIAGYVRSGKKVLITCKGGFNRSALVAGFAMHELTGKPGAELLEPIRKLRGRLTAPEAVRLGCTYEPPTFALHNPQFVKHLTDLKARTYDADVLIYDVVGGAYTSKDADSGTPLGGSELEVTQVAHALSAHYNVVVANQIKEPVTVGEVRYVPFSQCVGMRVKTLYVQRHSPCPTPAVEADRICIRSTDLNDPAYRTHDAILSSGEAELLCVSQFQASLFPHAKRRCIVPSPLAPMPKVAKVPGRFVYVTAPAKGLEPTLGVWAKLKAEHASELASAKLLVTAPRYKFGKAPELTEEMRAAGVEYVKTDSLEDYRKLIASAQGVFYVAAFQETYCIVASLCERSHTRFHFWPMVGAGGTAEALTNTRLTASSQEQFEADFMTAWREPDRAEWYATGKLADLSVAAVLPVWERALRLVDQVPDDPKAPLYLAADTTPASTAKRVPFIATPAYGGMLTLPYVASIVAMMSGFKNLGIDPTLHMLGNESLITRARNNCVADFLKSDCTHLFFVDADIGFNTQHMIDMLYSDLDVVFGAYPKKSIAWDTVLRAASEGKARTAPELEQFMADFAINFQDESLETGKFKVIARNGQAFMAVKEASTGFCCISRTAILKMIEAYGSELEYVSDSNMGYGEKRYALFDCPICPEGESDAPLLKLRQAAKAWEGRQHNEPLEPLREHLLDAADEFGHALGDKPSRYLSEDYGFSRRWASLGGEVWVYVGAQLTHTGTHTFQGNFAKMFDVGDSATTHVEP